MRGQVVDVDLVALGDVEGAAVTRTVEKVVVVGRAGREAEATGEHVEDAEHLGEVRERVRLEMRMSTLEWSGARRKKRTRLTSRAWIQMQCERWHVINSPKPSPALPLSRRLPPFLAAPLSESGVRIQNESEGGIRGRSGWHYTSSFKVDPMDVVAEEPYEDLTTALDR